MSLAQLFYTRELIRNRYRRWSEQRRRRRLGRKGESSSLGNVSRTVPFLGEALEPRLLLSVTPVPIEMDVPADGGDRTMEVQAANATSAVSLNSVIDGILSAKFDPTLNPNPTGTFVFTNATDPSLLPNLVTVGTTLNNGVDLQLENVTLTFSGLRFLSGGWTGTVGVEAEQAVLFEGILDIEVTDDGTDATQGDDADVLAVAGVIDLAAGSDDSFLNLDDLDAEQLGWPTFLDAGINELAFNFDDFRVDDNLNSLRLEVALTGFDTGNDALNELLSADNPLFGLSIQGSASGTLAIKEIEDTVRAAGNNDVVGALQEALAAAMASDLDGLTGSISGKLFKVGDISAGFIYHKLTVDPDGGGQLPERSAGYLAVEGGFSIGDEIWGGRSTKFDIAFAVSDLGPLQFFISGGPIKRFEPTTGLTIEEAHLGVRFNTTIEELQTETDFVVAQQSVQVEAAPAGGFLVTLTIEGHDFEVGNELRVKDADNSTFDGIFDVLTVNGDQVTYRMEADPGLFVGSANIIRLTITDPLDLRDEGLESGIAVPDDIFAWRDQLDLAVTNQILAGDDIWAQLFGEVVIGGGATLSIDPIPDTALQLKVDLLLDTDFRILMRGNLSLADGLVELPASLYGDLSELFDGSGRFLFLADIPEVPVVDPLLVLRGEVSFEALAGALALNAAASQNGGFWDVTMELALDDPSSDYMVGDKAVVFGWQSSSFDGTYGVIAVDDAANTITVRSAVDPGVLSIGNAGKVVNENALAGGFRIAMEGGIDLNIPSVTTVTLEGEAEIAFKIPGAGPADLLIDLSYDVALSETNVGNIGAANGAFHVSIDADIVPDVQHPVGGVEIWGAALLTTDFQFLESAGLFASATGLLRINSTNQDKPAEVLRDVNGNLVSVALPSQSFALRLDGAVDFRIQNASVFQVSGIFVLELSSLGFNVAMFDEGPGGTLLPASLELGPDGHELLTFDVFGFLAIRGDGFAASLVLSADAALPLNLASIEATAVLVVNTTGRDVSFSIPGGGLDPNRPTGLTVTIPRAAPADPSQVLSQLSVTQLINGSAWSVPPATAGSPYGVVFLTGSLELLSVLDLDVSGYVLLSPNVVSLEANFFAAGSFLNLVSASASGSLFFSSEGEFQLLCSAGLQLGPDCFNIAGSAALNISYLDDNGKASGGNGNRQLAIAGTVNVSGEIFCISTGTVTLGVGYSNGDITVSVGPVPVPFWDSSCWDTFLGEICIYYPNFRNEYFTFVVGHLTIAPEPPPPPVLGQVDVNGVLTLNVGPDAVARRLQVDEVNEIVSIGRSGAGTQRGEKIQLSMFGVSQTFDNVLSILIADMGAGNDFVEILPGVVTPLEVHFGSGSDRLDNEGSGIAVAYGDGGTDRLEGGNNNDRLFGGQGEDYIDGRAGQDWIEGGNDNDTLIGGAGDDTMFGDEGADFIAGDHAVLQGILTDVTFETIGSAEGGSDNLHGGGGNDFLFGGSGSDIMAGDSGIDHLFGDDGRVVVAAGALTFTSLNLGFSGNDRINWAVGDGNDIVDGQLGGDVLTMLGTDNPEAMTVSGNGIGFTAAIGAATLSVNGVETSNLEGRGGGDTMMVNDLTTSVLRQLNLTLGEDSDLDTVTVNGSVGGDEFTIGPTGTLLRVQKTGGVTIDIADAGNGSSGDLITLNTEAGPDIVNVRGTRAGTVTVVNAGGGNDTVNVGSLAPATGGVVSDIAAPLVVHGQDGDDTLAVDDTGNVNASLLALTATTITGLGMPGGITYGTMEHVSLGLGSGGNQVNIRFIDAATTVNTGHGDDTITIGSVAPGTGGLLDAISAPLTLDGQGGNDTLIVDDSGDSQANRGTLTATTLMGLGMAGGIAYAGLEALEVLLGGGDDMFAVNGTMTRQDFRTVTSLHTGAGNDAVTVSVSAAADGPLAVNLEAGDDQLDASTSTAGVVIFGGVGADRITGGWGDDTIFGDRGVVEFSSERGTLVTRLGIEPSERSADPNDSRYVPPKQTDGGFNQRQTASMRDAQSGGDDTVIGGLGDDHIWGGAGADILLGDAGQVVPAVNLDGTAKLNPNGSRHRDVLLTDVATITGAVPLSGPNLPIGTPETVTALVHADIVLLTGLSRTDGTPRPVSPCEPETRAILLTLLDDGNDTVYGGEGDDAIYGQRGDDRLEGDGGVDFIAGGAGSDLIGGGDGRDTLVGDRALIDSADPAMPNVAEGFHIVRTDSSLEGSLGIDLGPSGVTIVPMVSIAPGREPNAAAFALPHVSGYGPMLPAENSVPTSDGDKLVPYASVITDVAHHVDLLQGNDRIAAGDGNDTLVGDDLVVITPALTFDAATMAKAHTLTDKILDIADDFSDLVHRLEWSLNCTWPHAHDGAHDRVVIDNVYHVGEDDLDGGEGDDVVIGDRSTLLAPGYTLPVNLAGQFKLFHLGMAWAGDEMAEAVGDLAALEHRLRDTTIEVPFGKHVKRVLVQHVDRIMLGSDTIHGGLGNDVLIGDMLDARAPSVVVVAGTPGMCVDGWQHWYWGEKGKDYYDHDLVGKYHSRDRHLDHRLDQVEIGSDRIYGDAGNDVIWGDDVGMLTGTITRGAGVSHAAFNAVRRAVTDALARQLTVPSLCREDDDHGDSIFGGDGDDVIFGQEGEDRLCGEAGNDWLIGGTAKDLLNGGSGQNHLHQGNDDSRTLRTLVRHAMPVIDWSGQSGAFFDLAARSVGNKCAAPWLDEFLNHVGRSESEHNPNADVLIRLS